MDIEVDCVRLTEVTKRRVGSKAIGHYGALLQCVTAIEEMSELCQAISKGIRGQENKDNLAEEIADVEIMLEQLKQIYGCRRLVVEWTNHKLARTLSRIKDEEKWEDAAGFGGEPGADS